MDAPEHSLENCWPLKHKIQDLIDANLIRIDPANPQDIHSNPLPAHNVAGSSVKVIFSHDKEFDPSQLIIPRNDSPYLPVITHQRKIVPLIAPVEYTPANPFVLKSTSTTNVPSLAEQTSRLTLSPKPHQFTPVLILQAKSAPENDIREIGGVTRSGRVYR